MSPLLVSMFDLILHIFHMIPKYELQKALPSNVTVAPPQFPHPRQCCSNLSVTYHQKGSLQPSKGSHGSQKRSHITHSFPLGVPNVPNEHNVPNVQNVPNLPNVHNVPDVP